MKLKIEDLKIEKRAFINGEYVAACNGAVISRTSSADGRDISGLSACGAEDINHAVAVARKSFSSRVWTDKEPGEKKAVLLRLADLIEEHREEIALLDCVETGRALKNCYYDSIPKAIEAMRYFAESIDKQYDHAILPRKNAFATITREPLGVVGLITPWNDPMVVSVWKLAPALLMGNSVVLKPAEQSSFSLIRVAALAKEAGIPDGVVNVVPGYGECAGKALALHLDVDGIFFTGSSQVGKLIMSYAGESNMKKVGLECGGKSAFVVSSKCGDLKEAAAVLARNVFYNQGQICSAPSRLIIEKSNKDLFVSCLLAEEERYRPGNPFDISNEVGCLVSQEQRERVLAYIQAGLDSGARLLTPEQGKPPPGRVCVSPAIFDGVAPDSILAQEEVFGPVLAIISVGSIAQAVEVANSTRYGLAASIWTDDMDEAYQVSRLLKAGLVHINSYGDDDNSVPFGGVKESGIGKDKSVFAFDEYSELKTTWIKYRSL